MDECGSGEFDAAVVAVVVVVVVAVAAAADVAADGDLGSEDEADDEQMEQSFAGFCFVFAEGKASAEQLVFVAVVIQDFSEAVE